MFPGHFFLPVIRLKMYKDSNYCFVRNFQKHKLVYIVCMNQKG